MALLFFSKTDRDGKFESSFRNALNTLAPQIEVRTWPSVGNADDITYAALWLPPEGLFESLPNLTHIFALSAGVDRLLQAPDLPNDVPIYRLIEGGMGAPMSEYVLFGVLQAQRQMNALASAQSAKQWTRSNIETRAAKWEVGILGAGVLASAVAKRLVLNGYPVRTWSRSRKNIESVKSYAGENELEAFCIGLKTVVCLLPLTSETEGTLNQAFFAMLPRGTSLINVARGEHCVDDDLIEALDSGQISSALLDVFHEEPLPIDHPFWSHPRVQVTPHIAAPTAGDVTAMQVAKGINEAFLGRTPEGLVNRTIGY